MTWRRRGGVCSCFPRRRATPRRLGGVGFHRYAPRSACEPGAPFLGHSGSARSAAAPRRPQPGLEVVLALLRSAKLPGWRGMTHSARYRGRSPALTSGIDTLALFFVYEGIRRESRGSPGTPSIHPSSSINAEIKNSMLTPTRSRDRNAHAQRPFQQLPQPPPERVVVRRDVGAQLAPFSY